MRLHAYLVQALIPGEERLKFAQLPGIQHEEVTSLSGDASVMEEFVLALDAKGDSRIEDVKTALQTWGRLELVDASFKGLSTSLSIRQAQTLGHSGWGTSHHTIVDCISDR
jgi:translocation protein SEC63